MRWQWCLCVFFLSWPAFGQNFQGFTGSINTPDASTLKEGDFYFQYSNQVEVSDRFDYQRGYIDGNSLLLGLGVFDNLEISGRNVSADFSGGSDLSLNAKYQLPWDFYGIHWAFGVQDLGGQLSEYDGQFAVMHRDFGSMRASFGLGVSDSSIQRMDGVFGSLQWQALSWASFAVEHDADQENYGIQLDSGALLDRWKIGLKVAKGRELINKNSSLHYMLSVTSNFHTSAASHYLAKSSSVDWRQGETADVNVILEPVTEDLQRELRVLDLQSQVYPLVDSLQEHGFTGVRVAYELETDTYHIEVENFIYNRNYLDAIAAVLELAFDVVASDSRISLTLMKYGIPSVRASVSLSEYQKIRRGRYEYPFMAIEVAPHRLSRSGLEWVEGRKSSYFKPRVIISPVLASAYGTEVGVVDYSLAARVELELGVWLGAKLQVTADQNLSDSDDFSGDGAFSRFSIKSGVKDILLAQTFRLWPEVTSQFLLGVFQKDYKGITNENRWDLLRGRWVLSSFLGSYHKKTSNRLVYLVSAQHYVPRIDADVKVVAGQFWGQDTGLVFDFRKHYGDSLVSLFFKKTGYSMVGVAVSIPLTFRKDTSWRYLQVRGSSAWKTGMATVIENNGRNPLVASLAEIPDEEFGLGAEQFNNNRLSDIYIENHVNRLSHGP